jgi:hypothetical protein
MHKNSGFAIRVDSESDFRINRIHTHISHLLNIVKPKEQKLLEVTKTSKKFQYTIEVKVPDGAQGWRNTVDNKMKEAIDSFKASIEELGGRILIRY